MLVLIVKAVSAAAVIVGCACIYDILRDAYLDLEWRQRMVLRFKMDRNIS